VSIVLVVEDEREIAQTVCELLREEGHTAIPAGNGEEAMRELSRAERPCVIFLDLMMPVMDGWQVLEALRHDAKLSPIPVIVTSAMADAKARRLAQAIIRKPYKLDQLLDVVDRFCPPTAN